MSYKAGILASITELKDRTGTSSIAIKKHMQANLPADKKWMNTVYLKTLQKAITDGDLVALKGSYKPNPGKKPPQPKTKPPLVPPKTKSPPSSVTTLPPPKPPPMRLPYELRAVFKEAVERCVDYEGDEECLILAEEQNCCCSLRGSSSTLFCDDHPTYPGCVLWMKWYEDCVIRAKSDEENCRIFLEPFTTTPPTLTTEATEGPLTTEATEGPLTTMATEGPLTTMATEGPLTTEATEGPLSTTVTEGRV